MNLQLSRQPACARTPDGRTVVLAGRDAALLAWLALEGPTPRQRLAALLWPEAEPAAARNALRQRLFQLRRHVGEAVAADGEMLRLAPGVAHDLDLADAVLGGRPLGLGPECEAWLAQRQQQVTQRMVRSLAELCALAEDAGDGEAALGHAREWLALAPLDEAAHRAVMRAHHLRGDRAAALLAFDHCERTLKDEVATPPSAETLALLATLAQSGGPDAAVPVRPVLRPPAALLRPPRRVGREAEWAALQRAWTEGRCALVEGEAGLGKSRLLGDWQQVVGEGALAVSARPGDGRVPQALLDRLEAALQPRGAAAGRRGYRDAPPTGAPTAGAPTAVADHRARAPTERLMQVQALLRGAASGGGVQGLVLDDLHHADDASLELLQALHEADPVPGLAWVLAFRRGDLGPAGQAWAEALADRPDTVAITLQPLDPVAVGELLQQLHLPTDDDPHVAEALVQRTGGNPLFLLEALKAWWLRPDRPAALTTSAAWPDLPHVVQLIQRRLLRLSPAALRLARCAALAGQDFETRLAVDLLGTPALDLADAWGELEAAQVLRGTAFAHDLVREAALATVPPALARLLHGQLAEWLSARGTVPGRVAEHWLASDTPLQAVAPLREAALQAAAAVRPREAVAAAVRAADLLASDGRSDAALDMLLEVWAHIQAPADGDQFALLGHMERLAATPLDRARVGERQAELRARSGDFAGAGPLAEAALAHVRPGDHPALAARLLCTVAAGLVAQGRLDEAVERVHTANDLAVRSGDPEVEVSAANYLASVLGHAGRPGDAHTALRHAVDLAVRHGLTPGERVTQLAELAGNRVLVGDAEAALVHAREARALAAAHGIDLRTHWPTLGIHDAQAHLLLGRFRDALHRYEAAEDDIARAMPHWLPGLLSQVALLWIHLGQWARARQVVERALAMDTLPRFRWAAQHLAFRIEEALKPPGAPPVAVPQLPAGSAWPEAVRHGHELHLTLRLDPDEGYARALALRDAAQQRQMPGQALEAEVRCAQAATRAGDALRAAQHARAALQRLQTHASAALCRGEVGWVAVQALALADPAEARRLQAEAAAWLRANAAQHVPLECRDSYLLRNPHNRALLGPTVA